MHPTTDARATAAARDALEADVLRRLDDQFLDLLRMLDEVREHVHLMRRNDPGPSDAADAVLERIEERAAEDLAGLLHVIPPSVVRSLMRGA
jgi:hypothetical protein